MEYRKYNEQLYIRLDKGDEIVASLLHICEREGITLAGVEGIGGCSSATVGVFDLNSRSYREQQVTALLELVSLNGNITLLEGKPFLHAHATFAYHDEADTPQVLAGHLLKAEIGLTGEIILTPAEGKIARRYDESLGIRVWDFN